MDIQSMLNPFICFFISHPPPLVSFGWETRNTAHWISYWRLRRRQRDPQISSPERIIHHIFTAMQPPNPHFQINKHILKASWEDKLQKKERKNEWMCTCAKSRGVFGRGFEEDEGRVGRGRREVDPNLDLFSRWRRTWVLQLRKRKQRKTFQEFSSERELVMLLSEWGWGWGWGFGRYFERGVWSWANGESCHCL